MSISEELRELSETLGYRTQVLTMQRAADELDAANAKLDQVRTMCLRRLNPSVTTGVQLFAGEVLAAIDKETNDG